MNFPVHINDVKYKSFPKSIPREDVPFYRFYRWNRSSNLIHETSHLEWERWQRDFENEFRATSIGDSFHIYTSFLGAFIPAKNKVPKLFQTRLITPKVPSGLVFSETNYIAEKLHDYLVKEMVFAHELITKGSLSIEKMHKYVFLKNSNKLVDTSSLTSQLLHSFKV